MMTRRIAGFAAVLMLILGARAAWASPYETAEQWLSYAGADAGLEVPAAVIAPKRKGSYPAVMYVHGRWGLTPEVLAQLHALAARGVVILAPDYYFARAIPQLALFNDLAVEKDIAAGIAVLREIAARKTKLKIERIGLLAQDHGGYFALRIAAARAEEIGAFVGVYPIAQNPNSPKAKHIYGYMESVDRVMAPSLFLIGGEDREMRRIHVKRVFERLQTLKRTTEYIEYPGAGRCYDWRVEDAANPDRMARLDSLNQTVRFLRAHLGGNKLLVLNESGWEEI